MKEEEQKDCWLRLYEVLFNISCMIKDAVVWFFMLFFRLFCWVWDPIKERCLLCVGRMRYRQPLDGGYSTF